MASNDHIETDDCDDLKTYYIAKNAPIILSGLLTQAPYRMGVDLGMDSLLIERAVLIVKRLYDKLQNDPAHLNRTSDHGVHPS